MDENKNTRTRGVTIRSPQDVQRIARRVISDIFASGTQIEEAGKVNQLLITWLKGWEAVLKEAEIKQMQEDIKLLKAEMNRR